MDFRRIFKHLVFSNQQVRKRFPQKTLDAIEQAISSSEIVHCGEIRFAIEGALSGAPLYQGQTARERAIEVFAQLRVWDTEYNNGVLIYVLLADRAVEIVADRGIHVRAGAKTWDAVCRQVESAFEKSEFHAGVLLGIESVSNVLADHYPAGWTTANELPDTPVLLT